MRLRLREGCQLACGEVPVCRRGTRNPRSGPATDLYRHLEFLGECAAVAFTRARADSESTIDEERAPHVSAQCEDRLVKAKRETTRRA